MKKLKREIVICPVCGINTFNDVETCKCGHKFPYHPLQDEIMIDICSNCRTIKEYKMGFHVGGTYTVCPICNNGKLVRLDTKEKWIKRSENDKQKCIAMVEYENLGNDDKNLKPHVECPYCHSTNTKKISAISKMWSLNWLGMYGIGKVSKQWHCNNCDSDF